MSTQTIAQRTGLFAWKGEPQTLLGHPVRPGDRAPDFTVTTIDFAPFTLRDALAAGTRAAVFVAVSSIDTGVCSKESRTFEARANELPAGRVAIFVVSMDLPYAQKRWCGAEDASNVVMLSDYLDHSFGLAYGIRVKERGLLARSIFVVDAGGIVREATILPEVTQEPDYDQVIASARAAAGV